MRVFLAAFVWLLTATSLMAQSGSSVRQSGNITPNHVPSWVTNGVIGDGGTAADSPLTSFGVTSNTTAGICVSSGRPTAAGRQQLCFGAPLDAAGVISIHNYGTATPQGLNFNINGVTTSIPATGGDFVTGVGPYTVGGIPCFTGTTSQIHNCGDLGLGTMSTQNANSVAITGGTIIGMPSPSASSAVANKAYVDAVASGLNIMAQSTLATAAVLPNTPTYANGTLGVGATLTAGSNSTLTVDGTVAALNAVVLVKDQAAPAQNGVYTVTTAGNGGVPWVLTRTTYFDQAAEMKAGSYTFITSGATNINSSWTLQAAVVTVGTDALNFAQFSAFGTGVTNATIAAGTGIAVSGTCAITTSGTCTIATQLSDRTNSLLSNVALNNSTYTLGPAVTQGTVGTWLFTGQVTVLSNTGGDDIFCRLWDQNTVIASGQVTIPFNGAKVMIPLSGVLASPAGFVGIYCINNTSNGGNMLANASGNAKDSTLTAVRIQ